jgi:hypothetical protein
MEKKIFEKVGLKELDSLDNVKTIDDYIKLIENVATLNNSVIKKYERKNVDIFCELLETGKEYEAIEYMFNYNLNLEGITGINYQDIKTTYENTKQYKYYDEKSVIKNSDIVKRLLKKFKEKGVEKIKNTLIDTYKNNSRKKGSLLKKIIMEYKDVFLLNGFDVVFSYDNFIEAENNQKEYIYIPEKDENILLFLKAKFGIEIDKGKDAIIKLNNVYYICEAKEIHTSGGSQSHQLKDLIVSSKIIYNVNGVKIKGLGIVFGAIVLSNLDSYIVPLNNGIEKHEVITLLNLIYNLKKIYVMD